MSEPFGLYPRHNDSSYQQRIIDASGLVQPCFRTWADRPQAAAMCAARKSAKHRATASILVGAVAGGAGTHAALWLTVPHLAATLTLLEAALPIAVILTALYAPKEYSNRAFQILAWTIRQSAKGRSLKVGKQPHREQTITSGKGPTHRSSSGSDRPEGNIR